MYVSSHCRTWDLGKIRVWIVSYTSQIASPLNPTTKTGKAQTLYACKILQLLRVDVYT